MTSRLAIAGGLLVLGLLFSQAAQPEGIRNNNPLNIEANAHNHWVGQIGVDANGKVVFDTVQHGIRAATITMRNYQQLYGYQTVPDIIGRWAPSVSNPTGNYVAYVEEQLGLVDTDQLDLSDDSTAAQLIQAMIGFENGKQPYPYSTILEGVQEA